MINRKDAIKAGKAIIKTLPIIRDPLVNRDTQTIMRGMLIHSLDNFYHDALTDKIRDSFGSRDQFYAACGW